MHERLSLCGIKIRSRSYILGFFRASTNDSEACTASLDSYLFRFNVNERMFLRSCGEGIKLSRDDVSSCARPGVIFRMIQLKYTKRVRLLPLDIQERSRDSPGANWLSFRNSVSVAVAVARVEL